MHSLLCKGIWLMKKTIAVVTCPGYSILQMVGRPMHSSKEFPIVCVRPFFFFCSLSSFSFYLSPLLYNLPARNSSKLIHGLIRCNMVFQITWTWHVNKILSAYREVQKYGGRCFSFVVWPLCTFFFFKSNEYDVVVFFNNS